MKNKAILILLASCAGLAVILYYYHKNIGLRIRQMGSALASNEISIEILHSKVTSLEGQCAQKALSAGSPTP
jgi:hypothetical protein